MKKKPIYLRVGLYFAVFALLLALLYVVNQYSNQAGSDNVYGIPSSRLSADTIALLNDPNYQNIILPGDLDQKLSNKESFFVYYFSSTCPYCRETTPKLNPIIEDAGVSVDQFNLDVYKDGFQKYNIVYTPTLIYYENGVESERIEGGLVANSDVITDQTFIEFFERHKEKASS